VRAHGGQLDITSEPKAGTDISLSLPVGKPGEDREELPPHLQRLIAAARKNT
jgi:hypothetical protein